VHFFSQKSSKSKKVKYPLLFLSIRGNLLVIFSLMFFLPKTINSCHLTVKALIKKLVTTCTHSVYLPAWFFRLFCLSVHPQKSYFFTHFSHFLFHLFYFFFSFLFFFFHFFLHFSHCFFSFLFFFFYFSR
jgi:hypothetical protein